MTYFLILAYFFCFITGLYSICKIDNFNSNLYNPIVIIGVVNFLYTLSPLIFFKDLDSIDLYFDSFMVMQITGFIGISTGLFSSFLMKNIADYKPVTLCYDKRNFFLNILIIIGSCLFLIVVSYKFGGILNIFNKGYSLIIGDQGLGDHDIFISVGLFYFFPMFILIIGNFIKFNNIWIFASIFYCGILSLMGTRNNILMYLGAAGIFISYQKMMRLSYIKIFLWSLIVIPFGLFLAVYRNQGAENISNYLGNISGFDFDSLGLNGGEFLTAFNVFSIHSSNVHWWNGYFAESYVNAFLSIIPKFIWSDRPQAISNTFSDIFANPGEGLGFSVNLEALVVFGYFGVYFINFLIGLFWGYVYRKLVSSTSILWIIIYSTIPFFAFNANRIDFQTIFKMTLIQVVFGYAIFLFLKMFRLR